jgi:hypothetical protein
MLKLFSAHLPLALDGKQAKSRIHPPLVGFSTMHQVQYLSYRVT